MWLWAGLAVVGLGTLLLDLPFLREKGRRKEITAASAAWAAAIAGTVLCTTMSQPPNPLAWIADVLVLYVNAFQSLFT